MASHFDSIGFELADESGFAELVETAATEGERRARADGGASVLWRDQSGASVAVHLDAGGAVLCAAPSFAATCRLSVRIDGVAADPECRFCSVLLVEVLEDDEMVYPLAVQLENIDEVLDRNVQGQEAELALAAFGEGVECWQDERTYDQASNDEPRLAAQALIPSGLFTPEPKRRGFMRRKEPEPSPQAHAIVTGIVEAAEAVRNATSGVEFVHARLATYGADLDVLLSSADVPGGLSPGNVVQGSFWLMGRLGEPPEVAG